jgi:two-component system, NarL family, response regulator DesR
MIRVLIAEDMHMIRGALVALLSLEDDVEVVAELERGDLIVQTALETHPDVAVVDIDLPGLDGLTAAEQLHQRLPECRTLVLTGLSQPGNLLRALKVHVRGFIVKDAPAETLADGVRRVARGERVIDPELVAAALEAGSSPLTARETDVLREGLQRRPDRPDRRAAVAITGDRAQLPVECDQQGRRPQPYRRHPHRPRRRLALS